MKKKAGSKHSIDFLFIIFIFMIFTFSAISSLLLAINFYRKTVEAADENSDSRVAIAYIRELIRQNDNKDASMSVDTFDGIECLAIEPVENYIIYIYEKDGELKELYTRKDAMLTSDAGKAITKLKSIDFSMEDKVLYASCEDDNGNKRKLTIDIKCKTGGN